MDELFDSFYTSSLVLTALFFVTTLFYLGLVFQEHEISLLEPLLDFLRSRDDVQIVGPDSIELKAPIISIIPKDKNLKKVYESLTEHKLMIGIGHFYAVRPLMDLEIPIQPGVLRIPYLHYTSKEEINQLIEGLKVALDNLDLN